MSKKKSKMQRDEEERKEEKNTHEPPMELRVAERNLQGTKFTAIVGLMGVIIAAILTAIIGPMVLRRSSEKPLGEPTAALSTTSLTSPSTASSCIYPPRYGFECGQYGWERTSYYENKAIQATTTTIFIGKDRNPSQVLALTVDFTGTMAARKNSDRESGEVQVDLNGFPPAGYTVQSVDLDGLSVVAWIWAPKGSIGDPNHKNGIQLFVKDSNDKNCYGAWNNIAQEEVWFRVSWQENNAALCDSDFDSSKPKLLGVKIAIGNNSFWTTNELLTFYVDDVDWQLP